MLFVYGQCICFEDSTIHCMPFQFAKQIICFLGGVFINFHNNFPQGHFTNEELPETSDFHPGAFTCRGEMIQFDCCIFFQMGGEKPAFLDRKNSLTLLFIVFLQWSYTYINCI